MGLLVWMPLNGNLDNQGLASVAVEQSGGTEAYNAGKIGQALQCAGNSFYNISPITIGNEATIAWWEKTSVAAKVPFTLVTDASSYGLTVWGSNSTHIYTLNTGDGANDPFKNGTNNVTSIYDGKWHHFAVTFGNSVAKLYIDGAYAGTAQTFKSPSATAKTLRLAGGSNNAHSYDFNGMLNDFRVYDYCLSPKEVRELSRALVVHYKLDENCQVMDNCYTNPTFNSSSQAARWSHRASVGSGSYSQNTNKDFIFNKSNTYSHKISYTGDGYYLCYQSPEFAGGYRSVQAIVKLSDGSEPDSTKIRFRWNAGVGTAPPTQYYSLGDGFYLLKVDGFRQSGSNDLVGIRINSGITAYISEAYLENDRKVCSDILDASPTVITDRSGYGRHAARMTPLIMEVDSPRYDLCVANSENYPLRATFDFPQTSGLTVACWVNMATWGWQGSGVFSTTGQIASTPTDYNSTTFNHYDGYIRMRGTNGTTYGIACPTISDIPVNGWHHVALTHDGSQANLYIDGVLKRTMNVPTPLVAFKRLYLGTSFAGGTNRACQGKWSDFRMYATALSAEDIKELYSVSASVDNLGNLHCYEAEELAENLFKAEYINEVAEKSINWVKRNDEHALALKPTNFYEGGVYAHILQGKFKPNTQYKFDLWMDVDEVVNSGTNHPGGLRLYYTDGTRTPSATGTGSLTMKGSSSSPKGFQHKVFYSDPDKSVAFLITYYYTRNNVYYRYDSVIIPMLNPTSFKKTGTVETGQFREDATMAGICKGDNFDINRMIEK